MSGRGAAILVVDDDPLVRRTLIDVLSDGGYRVATAENGRVALAAVAEAPPALVVCDLVMPEKEGIETIRELRRLHPAVKILAVSGTAGEGDVLLRAATALGADASLAKPFGNAELLAAVGKLLAAKS